MFPRALPASSTLLFDDRTRSATPAATGQVLRPSDEKAGPGVLARRQCSASSAPEGRGMEVKQEVGLEASCGRRAIVRAGLIL